MRQNPDSQLSLAQRKVLAQAELKGLKLRALSSYKVGDTFSLPLEEGAELKASIKTTHADIGGYQVVAGTLLPPARGEFSLQQGRDGSGLRGKVLRRDTEVAYRFQAQGLSMKMEKLPLSAALCYGLPKGPNERPAPQAAATRTPMAAGVIPVQDSRPTATAVIYLDFDGEVVTDPDWNSGATIYAAPAVLAGSAITTAQMTDVWQRVAEDFAPFNISVTTVRSRYDSAPVGQRALVVITPTDSWYSGNAGGVAFLKSFRGPYAPWIYSSTIPCWVWNSSSTSVMAMTVTHEVGHMMDLSHDGSSTEEYYDGHGSGNTAWGPLMGAPFSSFINQWNKGDYPGANNTEDDFAITAATIAESGAPGLATDDAGNTLATAKALSITSPVTQIGDTRDDADIDYWSFRAVAGLANFTATPRTTGPNLDAQLDLYDASGTKLASGSVIINSLQSTLSYSITTPGTYYLSVEGKGRPVSTDPGYSSYGSTGQYTLTGTYTPLPEIPVIVTQPTASTTVNQAVKVTLKVTAISNRTMTYQWRKNGVNIAGRTTNTLLLLGAPDDNANYDCVVTNSVGSVTSDPAAVTVLYKPIILTHPLPASRLAATGDTVSWTISARGTAPLAYQWKKNGVNLVGENADTLTLTSVDWFSAALYTCTVSNAQGAATTAASRVTVSSAPIFTLQPPARLPVALGSNAVIKSLAVGTAPITYKWYKDGNEMPTARAANLTLLAAKLTDEATYECRASNAVGANIASTSVLVDIQDKPVITTHPVALLAVNADSAVTLTCAATGTDPMTYQWQRNNVNVPGAVGSTLSIPAIGWLQRGLWRCVVSNEVGIAYSKACNIAVTSYPVIITQPVNTKIAVNGTGVLKVVAEGTATLRYQWFKDTVLLPTITPSLTLARASVATTNGQYQVRVYNTQGEVFSSTVTVAVEDPPRITTQPISIKRGIGASADFTVVASGSPTLTYQWQKNNINILNETNATLSIPTVASTSIGYYRCIVSNAVGKALSAAGYLTPLVLPVVTRQPLSQTVYSGDKVVLTVAATGSAPLTYQWQLNGSNIPVGGTTTTLTIPAIGSSGSYTCVVTNPASSATSNAASISVLPVPAPTVTDVRPVYVRPGQIVQITGTNLTWLKQVKLNNLIVPFTVSRPTEAYITLPAAAVSGLLTVETRGGILTPASLTVETRANKLAVVNDTVANAQFIPFTTNSVGVSDNTQSYFANGWPGEIWFRWRAPRTGTFRLSIYGCVYHPRCYIYSGPATPSSTSQIIYRDYFEYHHGLTTDYSYHDVACTMGQDYYFEIGSTHVVGSLDDFYVYGKTELLIVPISTSSAVMASSFEAEEGFTPGTLAGQGQWQGGSAAGQVRTDGSTQAAVVGGKSALGSQVSVTRAIPESDTGHSSGHTIKAMMEVNGITGVADKFHWQGQDVMGRSVATVTFDTSTQRISYQTAGTEAVELPTSYPQHSAMELELAFDYTAKTWAIYLDGIPLAQQIALPSSTPLRHLSIGWQPHTGVAVGGSMAFDDLHILAEDDQTPAPLPVQPDTTGREPEE